MSKSFFILTTHGEVGPVDRDGLRELLREGRVQRGDQVRNAFGRMLGTVGDQLGRPSGAQPAATASDRRPTNFAAQSSGRRAAVRTELNPRMVMLSAMAGLVLIGGTVAFLAARSGPGPAPVVPASPVAPVPSPIERPEPAKTQAPAPVATPTAAKDVSPAAPSTAVESRPAVTQQDAAFATLAVGVDDECQVWFNGIEIGRNTNWRLALTADHLPVRQGRNVLVVLGKNNKQGAGLVFDLRIGSRRLVSDQRTRCFDPKPDDAWIGPDFDDSTWKLAVILPRPDQTALHRSISGFPADSAARWVWSHGGRQKQDDQVCFRFTFEHPEPAAK